jgi:hypothetical protein
MPVRSRALEAFAQEELAPMLRLPVRGAPEPNNPASLLMNGVSKASAWGLAVHAGATPLPASAPASRSNVAHAPSSRWRGG